MLKIVALTLCAVLAGTLPVGAQYFGRNKVRYEPFDFKVLETPHFDIYHYAAEEAAIGRLKALHIFLTVLVEEDAASEYAGGAVEPLLDALTSYELPPPVKELLWHHAEQSGDFARAEDWLFALLEEHPDALEPGIAFYERLIHLADDELARGDLPRAEVAASLAELRARRTDRA